MFYVYKTVCLTNDKFYIGVHRSDDIDNDEYLGSGRRLRNSVTHHGKENFKREIIAKFDNEVDAFRLESELVTEELLRDKNCLNLALGGHVGSGPAKCISKEKRKLAGKSLEIS